MARALEIVGERWTTLVIRELLLGPRRFTDLRDGLPGISSNLLAERLKRLEHAGIVTKQVLPPPAASTVYELVPDRDLGHLLSALAKWGVTKLGRARPADQQQGRWLILGLAVSTRVPHARDETFQVHVDDDVLTLHVANGGIEVRQGPTTNPDAVITTDAKTLSDLVSADLVLERALTDGLVAVEGNRRAASQLLEALITTADWAR